MRKPLISIILTSYNCEKYIECAILSIINQTYKNWELIIVEDNSSDGSLKIIESWVKIDKRVILIKNKMNYGTYYSLNEGLKKSNGSFITKLEFIIQYK